MHLSDHGLSIASLAVICFIAMQKQMQVDPPFIHLM